MKSLNFYGYIGSRDIIAHTRCMIHPGDFVDSDSQQADHGPPLGDEIFAAVIWFAQLQNAGDVHMEFPFGTASTTTTGPNLNNT